MRRFLFPFILFLSIVPLKTLAEEYHIKFFTDWLEQIEKYAVVEKLNNTTWYVRQTTKVENQLTLFNKWWDHDVTFSRVCLLEKDGEEVLEDDLRNLKSKDGWEVNPVEEKELLNDFISGIPSSDLEPYGNRDINQDRDEKPSAVTKLISDPCIEGDSGLFKLPENSNIQDYSIEIKWIENDQEQYVMFELTDKHLK